MEEILKGKLYEGYYDKEEGKMVITKNYHIYYDRHNQIVHINISFPVRHLHKLRGMLRDRSIKYKTIIIGNPDI